MGFSYNVSVLNQKGSPAIYTDTFANRPAFGYAGRLFIANDTSAIYEDTGTAWVLIANVSSGAGTLQQVTTNGNTSNVGISVTAGGIGTNSLTDTALTLGSVLFSGAAGLVSQDNAAFFWDDTNNRLGLNTITPSNTLDVHFAGSGASIGINNTAGNAATIVFANTGTNKWRIGNSSSNSFDIINVGLGNNAISINTANSNVSFIESIKISQTSSIFATAGYNSIFASSTGFGFQLGTSTISPTFAFNGLTVSRNYVFPDAAGTIALTSDLSAYLPLTGGTLTGALNGTSGSFTSTLASTGTGSNTVLAGTGLKVKSSNANLYLNFSPPFTGATESEIASSDNGLRVVAGSTSGSANVMRFLTSNSSGVSTLGMSITGLQNILINTSSDNTVDKLQVTGSVSCTGVLQSGNITIKTGGASTQGTLNFGSTNGYYIQGGADYLAQEFFTNATKRLSILSTGVILITNLAGTGSRAVVADASGNLSAPVSDQLVKENIEPLKYGLETIMKLNAVQFEFIEGYKNYGEGLQIGAIAQEVEQIIPEAVFTTPSTGLKGINYDQFNGIYIKAIQDQQKIIESLLKRIEALENK